MHPYDEAIVQREKGAAPLSIATSLAFESICNFGEFHNPDIQKPTITNTQAIWVNLRTVFRNMVHAVDRDIRWQLGPEHLFNPLSEELLSIQSLVNHYTQGRVPVVFYYLTYEHILKAFPHALHRVPKTELQKTQASVQDRALGYFLKNQETVEVKVFNSRITTSEKTTYLLTHYPSDLLSRPSFTRLTLLESHTGQLKDPGLWYTKLTGSEHLTRIPFNKMTLQVFGEGTLFYSMLPSLKKYLVNVANTYQWTPMTTDDKVKHDLKKLYDPREREFFLTLFE